MLSLLLLPLLLQTGNLDPPQQATKLHIHVLHAGRSGEDLLAKNLGVLGVWDP